MANNNNMFLGNNSLNNFMNNTGFIAKATPTNSLISEAAKKSINEYVDSLGLEGMDKQLKIQELTQKTLKAKKQQEYNQGRADVKNDLAWKSMNASNEAEAQAYKSQGKLADLADMVRGYIRNAEGREIAGNDDEIVAAFLKDNQDMVAPFASYMSGDQSAYEFAQMFGFNATPQEIATDKSNRGWKSSLIGGEGERNDDILGHFDYSSYDEAGEGFWNKAGTFGLNLLKSTYNLGSDVVNMVANPIDTTNNLAKMLVGGAMNLTTLDDYLDPDGEGWLNSANQVADGLGDILKERYGSWEGIKNTAYTDPMGMVSDIASIIEGGAGALKGVTKVTAKGAAKAGMKGAASNLDNVSNYAGKVANIAHKADPFVEMMEGGAKGVKYLGNKAINSKTAGKIKDSATNLTDSIVGLDNETKKAIQSNPYAGSTWREVENYIDENGLPTRSQEVSKSLIADLSTAVQEDLKNYINQFNETGPLYKSLKNGNYSVDLTKAEYKTKLDDFLKEKGVIIGEDGSLNFSDTAVTPTEASAIRRAYSWLSPNEAQPVAQYIRHRKGIDQLGLWEDAKGTPGKEILKGMRELANEEAHNQIKPLKELDKLYSEQVDLLNKATEGLVYRDKRRFGEYRDNFNQILKNMDTPNRKRLKDRLEKILPGLEQKVSAINFMPKLIDNYYRPGKADKRLSSAGGVVGTALGGGLPGLAVGAGVGYGLSKLYDKIKTNKWNKAISNLSDEGKAKMAEIEKAIAANKALSVEQKAALKNIASELKANKAVKEGQIAEIMGKLTEVENINQLDNLIAEARKIGATDAVKELEQIKEQAVKDMAEQAEMDAYERQFNEVEKGQILDEAADQRLPEFKKRIYQLEQQEKRVGTVAGKKIGKTFEGKDRKKKQDTDRLRAKDKLIEEIAEYYNVDQFEAMDIYDRIYKSVGPDDMGLGKSQASSKTAKYQVADDMDKAYEEAVRAGDEAKAKEILRQYAESKGYKGTEDYKGRGAWAAPSSTVDKSDFRNLEKLGEALEDSGESSLYAVANGYSAMPEDMLERGNTWRYFRTNTEREAYYPIREAMDEIQRQMEEYGEVRDMPKVTVYRAVPDYSKSIKKLQSDIDKFIIGEDGKPHINGSLSQLSKDALESYDYYADMYKKYGGTTPEENLYERLTNDRDYKDSLSVKEGMLESGGEWVTPSKQYAKDHGNNRFDGEYKIIKDEIPADQLWWDGNAIEEWGFDDGNEYAVKKGTKNSRKNLEIEYDDKGNLIPLSKRFNEKKADPRYQKYGIAGEGEKGVSATEGLNIRNFKNGKTVQELADNYGIKTNIVDSISTPEGQRAYGMYGDRMITLAKDLKESTVPHELLHGVFDIVDESRKTSILEGIQKKLNIDNVQAEEWLADSFSEYYRTGKFDVKGIPTTFVGKVKQFFQQIKEYIDGTYANRKEIGKLFDDIIDGKIEGEYGVYSDPKFQSVWHGSPYSFEKFDSSNMGKGEGAQAHGWGHYVAVDKATGEHYADMGHTQGSYKGMNKADIYSKYGELMRKSSEYTDEIGELNVSTAIMEDLINGKTFEESRKYLKERMQTYAKESPSNKLWEVSLKAIDKMKETDFNLEKGKNLYEVEIPDPIKKDTPTGSNYLEESLQIKGDILEKIASALGKKYGINAQAELLRLQKNANMGYIDGSYLVRDLGKIIGSEKGASKFLESLGYDGIHYFGGRDGEAYVIFNDKALQITKHHKY